MTTKQDRESMEAVAAQMMEYREQIEQLEEQLKEAQAGYDYLSEEVMPELMGGVTRMDLEGITIKTDSSYRCKKITDPAALQWIVDNGHSGRIKSDVNVAYGMKDRDKAEALMLKLQAEGIPAKTEVHVHNQTATGLLNEMAGDGLEITPELLNLLGGYKKTYTKIVKK